MRLRHIMSVRFTDLDMEQLTKTALRKDIHVSQLIRKFVRSGLDADAAEFYADPRNRRTIGRGRRRISKD